MTDVLIIGAGPAGLSAAIACAENGLRVKILDEFVKPGGRLLGQLHQEPDGKWWNGIEEASALHERAMSLGVELVLGASVFAVRRKEHGWQAETTKGVHQARVLLLATGAAEWPVPIPGWTLPGVMSIGAAQVMTNVHRVRVGRRGVIIGVNLLAAAIARELQLAGIELAAMVLPLRSTATGESANPMHVMKSLSHIAPLAPSAWIRTAGKLLKYPAFRQLGVRFFPRGGVRIWGIPVHLRKCAVEIYGTSQVNGVRIANVTPDGRVVPGSDKDVPADFVCIAGGLYPLAELAAVAGCPLMPVPELGGYVPVHNETMQTPLPGLYVAGNITGIENARIAMAQGTVAGLSISLDNGKGGAGMRERLEQAVDHVRRLRESAPIRFHPRVSEGRAKMAEAWRQRQADQGAST